ncbi:MAG: hypothetical protein LBE12_03575 [Planctomycetaceae bacterium]|nr:hypothetical protein [Planctomycetaceae bacterium]
MHNRRCSAAQPTVKMPNRTKPCTGRDYQLQQSSSRHCRALEKEGVPAPAVALRFTAGYAFHTPIPITL